MVEGALPLTVFKKYYDFAKHYELIKTKIYALALLILTYLITVFSNIFNHSH